MEKSPASNPSLDSLIHSVYSSLSSLPRKELKSDEIAIIEKPILQMLDAIPQWIQGQPGEDDRLRLFVSAHYEDFTSQLLSKFLTFNPELVDNSSFSYYFSLKFPPSQVLLSLITALRSTSQSSIAYSESVLVALLRLLSTFFYEQKRLEELLQETNTPLQSLKSTKQANSNKEEENKEEEKKVQSEEKSHQVLARRRRNAKDETETVIATLLTPFAQLSIDSIASLPDIILNLFRKATPSEYQHEEFYRYLIDESLAPFLSSSSPPLHSTAALFTKLTRLGHAKIVVQGFLHSFLPLLHSTHVSPAPLTPASLVPSRVPLFSALFLEVQVIALEQLVETILRQLADSEAAQEYEESTLDLVLPCLIPPTLLKSIAAAGSSSVPNDPVTSSSSSCLPIYSLFDDTLVNICNTWASSAYLHHNFSTPSSSSTISSLGTAILCALSLLHQQQKPSLLAIPAFKKRLEMTATQREASESSTDAPAYIAPFASHRCLPPIMSGVQMRMSSEEGTVRGEGMKIAVEMSRLMDETRMLDFGAAEKQEEKDREEAERVEKEEEIAARGGKDAIVETAEWADQREDLRKVPYPVYLRQVLDYLRKQEEKDHIEAALLQAEKIIRRRPGDLGDVACELITQLLQVGTCVFLEDAKLNLLRIAALIAITVICPTLAAPHLIGHFYGQSLTLMAKAEVLDVLVTAAEELSGGQRKSAKVNEKEITSGEEKGVAKIMEYGNEQEQKSSSLAIAEIKSQREKVDSQDQTSGRAAHELIIRQRVEKKTRRWGRATQPPPSTTINYFAPVAYLFFYPLLNRIANSSGWGAVPVLNGEPFLLIRTLDALSMFVLLAASGGASGGNENVRRMSTGVMEIVWTVRTREEGSVRKMALVCLVRMMLTLSANAFTQAYENELSEIATWLISSAEVDPDPSCREFARFSIKIMKEKIDQAEVLFNSVDRRQFASSERKLILPAAGSNIEATTVAVPSSSQFLKFM